MPYAHSANAAGNRHDLTAHLGKVAELAAQYATSLGVSDVARCLGLWHDIGKFAPSFQQYLLDSEAGLPRPRRGPDHKAAGATLAQQYLGTLAMLIKGHHGGLCSPTEFKSWLAEHRDDPSLPVTLRSAREAVPGLDPHPIPPLPPHPQAHPLEADLFLRLLFSALVDADYLDTERHFSPDDAAIRRPAARPSHLWPLLERAQANLTGKGTDAVSIARHAIYEACLRAAEQPAGLFRLTVPTGGGKTRSAMAFALRHATLHGQERVIVAIPFISITEQTADVYRRIFEPQPGLSPLVLEHHSGVFVSDEDDNAASAGVLWSRLAAENWDAPIVVTTTVQLFESLFSNAPGRARRLHRLANSVIILDEAQALPPHLLSPILDALTRLCRHYNTSVVFSTATQPAFDAIPAFRSLQATEIVPSPQRFFDTLKRVRYEWHTETPLDWPDIAGLIASEPQVLAVLNTKRDALALLDALDDPQAMHLSTLLCGAHRRWVIAEVRRRLANSEPCRLVSTQVVEAGVDLDFPVVLRALGPLDALIQAAGRCNREGRLPQGRVIIVAPKEGRVPPGIYKTATGITGGMIGSGALDLHGTSAPSTYFSLLYNTIATDRENIQKLRAQLDFPEVAQRFRMIEDDTISVIVNYGPTGERGRVQALVDQLRRSPPNARLLLRALQPYLVNIRRRLAERYIQSGLIAPLGTGLGEWLGGYDPIRGLVGDDPDPDSLVI